MGRRTIAFFFKNFSYLFSINVMYCYIHYIPCFTVYNSFNGRVEWGILGFVYSFPY